MGQAACGGHRQRREEHHEGDDRGHSQPTFRVLRSPGNLNNDFGVPLALLGLEPEHEVAVVELAMSAAGEIARSGAPGGA